MNENASERWERLERLYHAARERSPAERSAFLTEACGADTTLRRDLESLLSQDDGDGFLGTRAPKSVESPTNTSASAPFPDGTLRVYEIQGHIGAGGMGEVYRARDTTLGRDVAIKVLPRSVSDDPDRRARLEREARLLAALNHPHIAQVYGFEEFDGGHALVMEFVEGDTLDEMIGARARKRRSVALPIAKALALARQIADALDAAHEKGIVHRDLKPANIKVTPAGIVKVLDFGLAKAVEPVVAVAAITTEVSRQPVILGTIPYMSPEQARGEPVDKRADIWAFGCVLFEMLSGHGPFEGNSASDTLFRILSRDPEWAKLPAETPPSVRTLLDRCLRKDPSQRLHDIADARIELDDVERARDATNGSTRPATIRRERLAWLLLVAVAASLVVTVLLYRRAASVTDEALQWEISLPMEKNFQESDAVISPDGRQIAVAAPPGDTSGLWVRSVSGPPWRQIIGTQGATNPFWKPDSESIGFFVGEFKDRKLKTVKVAGGPVNIVCDVPNQRPMYGAWGSRGFIVFSGDLVLRRVAENGGNSTNASQLDHTQVGKNEIDRSPSFLPDGDHFLYLAQSDAEGNSQARSDDPEPISELRVGSLSSAETTSLGRFESNAVYGSGYLLFGQKDGRLIAQPFDLDSRLLKGDRRTVAENVAVSGHYLRGQFSVSTTGRLAYTQVLKSTASQLTWLDRKGRTLGTAGDPADETNLNLDRGGTRLLVTRLTESGGHKIPNIWLVELARQNGRTPLNFVGASTDPAWSPDESQIVFTSSAANAIHDIEFKLFRRSSSGTGDNELLFQAPGEISAPESSPNGRVVMFTRKMAGFEKRELWTIAPGDRNPKAFLHTPSFDEANSAFSPNGRWIAYEANYSGQYGIYVCRYPAADKRIPISTNGGRAPRWSGDGKELFFLAPDFKMMSVTFVETADTLQPSVPQPLFQTGLQRIGFGMHRYVVTKDGLRFLMPVRDQSDSAPVTVLLDWPAKLGK